jgi:hypothetical protein
MSKKLIWIFAIVLVIIVIAIIIVVKRRKKLAEIQNTAVTPETTVKMQTLPSQPTTPVINNNPVTSWPLKLGSKGFEVTRLQQYLNIGGSQKGINLTVDGNFGPATQAALYKVLGSYVVEKSFYDAKIANFETRFGIAKIY